MGRRAGRLSPPRSGSLGGNYCRLVGFFVAGAFLIAREEVGQRLDLATRLVGERRDVDETKRLRPPTCACKQPFGILGHVGLLEVVDKLRRLFALGFADCIEDADLWNPTETVVGGRPPTGSACPDTRQNLVGESGVP